MIWEKLLTDTDGPYVEVQSGRLFNQAAAAIERLDVLPHEGATEARGLYREVELMVAVQEMKAGRFDAALERFAAAGGRPNWPDGAVPELERRVLAAWIIR